jgi:SulP family sulfate permease
VNIPKLARRYLPIPDWGAQYNGKTFTNDLIVALIVTVMLIPQSPTSMF